MEHADIVILGAGAAGLFCAGSALGQGKRIIVIDHAKAPGEKIRISGGGRCNFTNMATAYDRFLSENPRFCASALARFSPGDFVALIDQAGIAWHEKTLGQLFCDDSARQVVDMLLARMRGAELWLQTTVDEVRPDPDGFRIATSRGILLARRVVVATGGRSIPKMGATGLGYDIARQFGLSLIEQRAGLVPLTFAEQELQLCRPLAGLSVEAEVSTGSGKNRRSFSDGFLFTHRGLSGPAILQISSYWKPGEQITVDLAPGIDAGARLRAARGEHGRQTVARAISAWLPSRLADSIIADCGLAEARLADQNNAVLDRVAARINSWTVRPVGSEGWRTAEVTLGGVDTRELDARDMQARKVPGLYFIGEVVDVTGWLGGYNFQWAWASAHAAGLALQA